MHLKGGVDCGKVMFSGLYVTQPPNIILRETHGSMTPSNFLAGPRN